VREATHGAAAHPVAGHATPTAYPRGVTVTDPAVASLVQGIVAGDRRALSRGITLVESTRPDHREQAMALVDQVLPETGRAVRLGISGPPGVGKSTFIEAFGTHLTEAGHRVAVLAVDPTSRRTGGSILGDKTRMEELARDPAAYIRPSPSGGELGGVARRTREALLLCEAAGFDVVLVETVGVGQSEVAVAEMVDTFLVLLLARSGDSLQGIKKGVLELADVLAVNKADGPHRLDAEQAAVELAGALHLLEPATSEWSPPVLTCSAAAGTGLTEVWQQIEAHRATLERTGQFERRRAGQQVRWMWQLVQDRLRADLEAHAEVRRLVPELIDQLTAGTTTPAAAAQSILAAARS